ncbi:MAG: hypothetical protein ACRDJC_23480, partial [Thermomicrobiales bacterium]
FADVATSLLVRPTNAEILQLAEAVDTIVCSRSRTSQVQSLNVGVPIIPLPFHVSQQSASRVLEILAGSRGAVAPHHNGSLAATGVLA